MPQAQSMCSFLTSFVRRAGGARRRRLAAALAAVATTAFAALTVRPSRADADDGRSRASRQAKKVTDQADPEGARHQGRRRDGPEDQARAQALPEGPRPEGRRRRRPGHAPALGLGGTTKNSSLNSAAGRDADVATVMAKIAECESGGNPTAVSPNGEYRGKYQFSQATWESLGGTGDPAEADENVQDMSPPGSTSSAASRPWPACSGRSRPSSTPHSGPSLTPAAVSMSTTRPAGYLELATRDQSRATCRTGSINGGSRRRAPARRRTGRSSCRSARASRSRIVRSICASVTAT